MSRFVTHHMDNHGNLLPWDELRKRWNQEFQPNR